MKNILILGYHRIVANNDSRTCSLFVKQSEFEKQIRYLQKKKYKFITLAEYLLWQDAKQLESKQKYCLITFDDGYADNYLIALPIFKKYQLKATIFVTAGFVDKSKPFWFDFKNFTEFKSEDCCLNSSQLKELAEAGIDIGSHTMNHFELNKLEPNEIINELAESKKILEKIIQKKVVSFCYPRGAYDSILPKYLKQTGYLGAVITPNIDNIPETNYTLKRVSLYQHDTMLTFKLKISPLFSWYRKYLKY